MKKAQCVLLTLTISFICVLAGIFIGRNIIRPDAVLTPAADISTDTTPESQSISNPALGKVDINTADEDHLMLLQGIGPSLAQRIISYRQEHGPFQSAADLIKVEGIGRKKLEGIMNYITVGGEP